MDSGSGPNPDEIYCYQCGNLLERAANFCPTCEAGQREVRAGREVFCFNCGRELDTDAVVCGSCGVIPADRRIPVPRPTPTDATPTTPAPGTPTDAGQIDRGRGSRGWHYAMVIGLAVVVFGWGAWILEIVIAGYVLSVVALYFDSRYVRRVSRWNPNIVVYAAGTVIAIAVVVPIYLFHRYRAIGL